jgi:hypothetical protein
MDTMLVPFLSQELAKTVFSEGGKCKGALQAFEDLIGQDTVALDAKEYYIDDYANDEGRHTELRKSSSASYRPRSGQTGAQLAPVDALNASSTHYWSVSSVEDGRILEPRRPLLDHFMNPYQVRSYGLPSLQLERSSLIQVQNHQSLCLLLVSIG